MAEQQSNGFTHKIAKRALAPLAHAAVTAATAYLMKKAMRVWQDKIQPRIEERGGGRTVAKETLETVAEKAGPASGPVGSLAEKVGGEEESSSGREAERKQREQRRKQRRRSLEKSGSS
jgi:hypothetical protein